MIGWFTRFLLCVLPYKDLSWTELGEVFYRFTLLKTPWFNIFLHRLDAKKWHPDCHDHPWAFTAILLKGGYYEYTKETGLVWRRPGSILYRPAEWSHNVMTPTVSWSIIITSAKKREWGFQSCGSPTA